MLLITNKKILILQLFLLVVNCEIIFSQELIEYKLISSEYFGNIINTELIKDSVTFNGFIIFEFPRENNIKNSANSVQYVISNFYFIDSLKDISGNHKRYYFDSYHVTLQDFYYQCITNIEQHRQDSDFVKFFEIYSNFKYKNTTKLPFLYRPLNTEIFFMDIEPFFLNENENKVYFIFKSSFTATAFRIKRKKTDNPEQQEDDVVIIFPVSKALIFEPVHETEIKLIGFTKSSWFPDYLFKKK